MNLPCAELSIVGSLSITLALLAPPLFYVVRCLYILPALLCHLYQWNIAQTNVEPKSLLKAPFLWIKVLLSLALPITWIGKKSGLAKQMCALRRSSWRPPSVNRAQLATTFALCRVVDQAVWAGTLWGTRGESVQRISQTVDFEIEKPQWVFVGYMKPS